MAMFRRRRGEKTVDPNERSPDSGVRYKDLAVVRQLLDHGADLTEPRHALYFLYFGSQDAATTAATRAGQQGFETTVRDPLPEYPDQWSLICEMHDVVLDLPTIREHGDLFEAIADDGGGRYDGWEASV